MARSETVAVIKAKIKATGEVCDFQPYYFDSLGKRRVFLDSYDRGTMPWVKNFFCLTRGVTYDINELEF